MFYYANVEKWSPLAPRAPRGANNTTAVLKNKAQSTHKQKVTDTKDG